jgi:hypothetical protein
MKLTSRDTYARVALAQVSRILGNMDRNPHSPTYGCCHRDFWLDKTTDFPDAVRQFGVHALALVYKHDFPGNIYYRKEKVRDWAIAGLLYWTSIQHSDGSFDEFYPNERGWVGPTAFTTFSSIESFFLLRSEFPESVAQKLLAAIVRATHFIMEGESEEDHLANHHAMACLTVWKAYKLLGGQELLEGYNRLWSGFLNYHNADEGWSREYDGIDPGYLSATVSFLAKVYQDNHDREILGVCLKSIETCSYFVYPNGFYAGSMGSRNTLHFYPHGFEVFSKEVPMAAAVAEKMLFSLAHGKLVPPEIMSDRYLGYRVPEFLQSYLDYGGREEILELVPYEFSTLYRYLPVAKIWIRANGASDVVANLAKGGVVKVFDKPSGDLTCNDCGFIGKLDSGAVITSHWVNPAYEIKIFENGFEVGGAFNMVPSNKIFTVPKFIVFRLMLLLFGWRTSWAHRIKGWIRKVLMLGNRPVALRFRREVRMANAAIIIFDEIINEGRVMVSEMSLGGEFSVRYVPQSRYFQSQELEVEGYVFGSADLMQLNKTGYWSRNRTVPTD